MLTITSPAISDDVLPTCLWRRMYAAFNYGDVLITIGTGKLTNSEEEATGLVGEHDYAIIDMKEYKDQQVFLVKNPWSEGTTWKGHTVFRESMIGIEETASLSISHDETSDGDRDFPLPPGTFWMGLNDVFQSFESIYLNWNPSLFSFKEDVHFNWDLSLNTSAEGSVETNPQYVICSEVGGIVWLLLSRHFTSNYQPPSAERQNSSSKNPEPGFIALFSSNNGGDRVISSEEATTHGPYVDSPNTLLKLELLAVRPATIVVAEQALPRSRNQFTLTAFSIESLSLDATRENFTHSVSQQGVWSALTAGGNASGLSYHTNPQFSLCLAETSDLRIVLECLTENLPVHVKLIWAKGEQVQSLASRDVVGDSGEYRKGFAFAKLHGVQAGVYTIVCSTFEQGQLGSFALRVKSRSMCTLKKIWVASAGRFVTRTHVAALTPGIPKLLAPIFSQRLNRVSAVARPRGNRFGPNRGVNSPLKLSFEHGQGPSRRILGNSIEDEYLDSQAGVHSPEVGIQPNMCEAAGVWLVIERLAHSSLEGDEYVNVEVLSDGPIEVHGWEVGRG